MDLPSPGDMLRQIMNDGKEDRRYIRVRVAAAIGACQVDVDREVPLGATAEETIARIAALCLEPGAELLRTMIEQHYEAQAYNAEG